MFVPGHYHQFLSLSLYLPSMCGGKHTSWLHICCVAMYVDFTALRLLRKGNKVF